MFSYKECNQGCINTANVASYHRIVLYCRGDCSSYQKGLTHIANSALICG